MRDFIILFIALFLVSCADAYMYPEVVAKAEEVCKNNESWEKAALLHEGYEFLVYCKNGARFGKFKRKEK